MAAVSEKYEVIRMFEFIASRFLWVKEDGLEVSTAIEAVVHS